MSLGKGLPQLVDRALQRLVSLYEKDNRFVLTESDLVNRASEIFAKEVQGMSGLSVHSELRPFSVDQEGKCQIIRDGNWQKQENENDGDKFDLAIIDDSEHYWNHAREKAAKAQTGDPSKLKYWRFLSYPCEAFKAVMEFKVRVRGNLPKIRKDMEKLKALHQQNIECFKFLVVLDRIAPQRSLKNIAEHLKSYPYIRFYGPRSY